MKTYKEVLDSLTDKEKKMLFEILEEEKSLLNKDSSKRIQIKKEIHEIIRRGVTLDDY